MSANVAQVVASEPSNRNGYRSFRLGRFELSRDEYFVTVHWPAFGFPPPTNIMRKFSVH